MELLLLQENTARYFEQLCDQNALKMLHDKSYIAIGAVERDCASPAIGILISRISEQILYPLWIYVTEDYRRMGVGSVLLNQMCKTAKAAGAEQIEASFPEYLEGMPELFRRIGFQVEFAADYLLFHTTMSELETLNRFQRGGQLVLPLTEVPSIRLKLFFNRLKLNQIFIGTALPIQPTEFIPESSACLNETEIISMILLRQEGETLTIPWFYVNKDNLLGFTSLVKTVLPQLSARFSSDTPVSFAVVNQSSAVFAQKLFPNAKRYNVYTAILLL